MTRWCAACGYAFRPLAAHHRLCRDCWRGRNDPSRPSASPSVQVVPLLDAATIKAAAVLTHPDRHPLERQEQAKRTTARLLEALEDARQLERG